MASDSGERPLSSLICAFDASSVHLPPRHPQSRARTGMLDRPHALGERIQQRETSYLLPLCTSPCLFWSLLVSPPLLCSLVLLPWCPDSCPW